MVQPVDAVVFDVGRVLFEWRIATLMEKVVPDPAACAYVLDRVVTEDWHSQHDQGRTLAEMVPERIAEYPEHEGAIRAWATRFNETIPGPVPGSHEIVDRLHAARVPLYAITNFGAEFWAAFRPTAPIFERFRAIVVSGEEKLAKPDPAIFTLAANRFGHDPQAMLFVDDNADNIAAARELGWQVHHFSDAPTLERDLRLRDLIS